VDSRPFGKSDLCGEMRRGAETVDSEAAAQSNGAAISSENAAGSA
jgi:hypothetical protein